MPANLKDLRNRIRSVRNTEQITKAMKLVSTAKFGKAQVAVVKARPYSRALVEMVRDVTSEASSEMSHPLLEVSDSDVVTVVVISSERGLCGSYNGNASKLAIKAIAEIEASGKKASVLCLGKKAFQILTRQLKPRGYSSDQVTIADVEKNDFVLSEAKVVRLISTPFDKKLALFAEILSQTFADEFKAKKMGKLVFVFTKFESAGNLPLKQETILPLAKAVGGKEVARVQPKFEPSPTALLEVLLPRYLTMTVQQILLDSIASEHCARMGAMESASRNAKEMLRKLQITYQRARQAAITRELIEIISGAEAL